MSFLNLASGSCHGLEIGVESSPMEDGTASRMTGVIFENKCAPAAQAFFPCSRLYSQLLCIAVHSSCGMMGKQCAALIRWIVARRLVMLATLYKFDFKRQIWSMEEHQVEGREDGLMCIHELAVHNGQLYALNEDLLPDNSGSRLEIRRLEVMTARSPSYCCAQVCPLLYPGSSSSITLGFATSHRITGGGGWAQPHHLGCKPSG